MSVRNLRLYCAAIVAMAALAGRNVAVAQSCSPTSIISISPTDDSNKIQGSFKLGQTFQSTVTNCLVQVTLLMCKSSEAPNQDLVVELRNATTQAGTPGLVPDLTGSPLATATVSPGSVAAVCRANESKPLSLGSVNAVFSSQASLTAGATYSLVFYQANNGGSGSQYYKVAVQKPGPYSSGQLCKSEGGAWDCPQSNGSRDTALTICTTACCAGCTYTQGYWKNHPEAWPVTTLTLGSHTYTQTDLLAILNQPVQGNGLIQLAHQLIAAKLNQANGACVPGSVSTAIAAADTLIGNNWIPPIGQNSVPTLETSALTFALDTYNSGCTTGGPPHCGSPVTCPVAP